MKTWLPWILSLILALILLCHHLPHKVPDNMAGIQDRSFSYIGGSDGFEFWSLKDRDFWSMKDKLKHSDLLAVTYTNNFTLFFYGGKRFSVSFGGKLVAIFPLSKQSGQCTFFAEEGVELIDYDWDGFPDVRLCDEMDWKGRKEFNVFLDGKFVLADWRTRNDKIKRLSDGTPLVFTNHFWQKSK